MKTSRLKNSVRAAPLFTTKRSTINRGNTDIILIRTGQRVISVSPRDADAAIRKLTDLPGVDWNDVNVEKTITHAAKVAIFDLERASLSGRDIDETTTSGATGGFQSSVVGFVSPLRRPKKMAPTQVDRFHADLKRALGQSESSMPRHNPTVRRIDAVLATLSEAYTGWEELDDDATELRIFIDNDADLYRGQTTSIHKNLMTKIGQGKYNRDLAVKLFMYLVDAGAQKYAKEYGTADQPWNKLFPKKLRELVAASLRNHFETEAALGNYNNYLPAKYSDTDVAAVLSAAGFKPR